MSAPDSIATDLPAGPETAPPRLSYGALFLRFLRFGLMAFGGPVAQIAMIRRELVDEERWISGSHFNKLLAVMQVLPGPEAHELCVHLGIRARGRIGGVLAGLGFMLPGLILMLLLAWAYTFFAMRSGVLGAIFLGVQAAVIAVIVRAVHRIGEHVLHDAWLWGVAIGAALASLADISFWIVLPAAGMIYGLGTTGRHVPALLVLIAAIGLGVWGGGGQDDPAAAAALAHAAVPTLASLFWTGLKGGLLTFGGAYTAIPFVRDDAVGRGWMTDAQFLDGLGLSGILPAPLVIFATFVGWVGGGLAGALATTAGMFLPAFAFSLLFYERLEAVLEHPRLQLFLTGVAAAVVGLIAVTTVELARVTIDRTPEVPASILVFLTALALVYHWKSKFATPVALGIGAIVGALALT